MPANMEKRYFKVILFKTVAGAMKAEKILKEEGLPFKLIPIPKEISPDCGICLRFEAAFETEIVRALSGKVNIEGIVSQD